MASASLGDELKRLRYARGLRQTQVPGFPQSTIAAWESGRRQPSPKALKKLAAIYQAEVSALMALREQQAEVVSPALRALQHAAQSGAWGTVWQTSYEFLQSQRQQVPTALYAAIEALMQQAAQSHPLETAQSLHPSQTLEGGLRLATYLRHLRVGSETLSAWFRTLAAQFSPDHPDYIKVLNNGLLYLDAWGTPEAQEWATAGISWAQTHHRYDRLPELWAAQWRLASYLGEWDGQAQTHPIWQHPEWIASNTYAHEDAFYGVAWRVWCGPHTPEIWHQIRQQAYSAWADTSPMPPWIALWDAAWAARRGDFDPLHRWVRKWMATGEQDWPAQWDWYLRDAMLIALVTKHPTAVEWVPWWLHYLQRHEQHGWYALTQALHTHTPVPDSVASAAWLNLLRQRLLTVSHATDSMRHVP